jgi:hypothetical protein
VWTIIAVPWTIGLLITVAFCVASVFVRYRHAAAQDRAQIKWFLYACAVFLIIYAIGVFLEDAIRSGAWFSILFDLAILMIPTASASRSCATGSTPLM